MSSQLSINPNVKMKRLNNNLFKKLEEIQKFLSSKKQTEIVKECTNYFNQLKLIIGEHVTFSETICDEINKLKNEINNNNIKNTINSRKTFAEITKSDNNNKNDLIHKNKDLIIVFPTQENSVKSSEELKRQIKSKIDIKEIGKIGINNIRKIKNNGLIIECNNKNECNLLNQKLNENNEKLFESKIPQKKNPRLIIYNLNNEFDSENREQKFDEIKETIISQNQSLKTLIEDSEKEELKIKYVLKARNPNFCHLIIETTPQVRKTILNLQKLNILWSRHAVKDFVSITRCFKCLGFGHTRDKCEANHINCSSCGTGGHSHKECSSSLSHKKCINCHKFNENNKNPNSSKIDEKHDALYSFCPSLLRIKNLIISKINYE